MRNENGKSIRGQEGGEVRRVIKDSLFPVSLFAIYLGVLFLMSGIHEGLLVLMNKRGWNEIIQTAVPMLYWGAVAVGLTLFTRKKIKDTYEAPLHRLAKATRQVAGGDFSVYVPKTEQYFTTSLAIIPLQLMGYYVSVAKGLDVDKPRNLAKSVTVE